MRFGLVVSFITLAALGVGNASAADPKPFDVIVQRESTKDGLVSGTLWVNGEKLGTCFENDEKKIPVGTYPGKLRTKSGKNFVQGPGGKLDKTGDFLLEIADVKDRTDILFHAGNKKEHSEGCVLCGPATKSGEDPVAPDTLKKLRLKFFDDQDTPSATPNKKITITVKDSK